MGPALSCPPLRPGAYEGSGGTQVARGGGEAYAYFHDIISAAHEKTPGMVKAAPFLEGELAARGIHPSAGKTAAVAQEVGPFGGSENRERAKARQRSLSGPGASAWLRAKPVGRFTRHASPGGSSTQGGDKLGMEEHPPATCPACGAAGTSAWHARLCHRAGAQVRQHQP